MIATSRTGRRPRRALRAWWLPVIACIVVRTAGYGLLSIQQLVGAAAAGYLLFLFSVRPALALKLLVIVLPFQLVITSGLYSIGLAGPLVRMLGLWKEVAVLGVLLAGWSVARRHAHRLDALDGWALAYVGLGTAYLAVPELLAGAFGSDLSVDTRFVAWRALVLPVLLLLGARHLRLDRHEAVRLFRIVAGVGIAMGAVVVFEFIASAAWNRLMIDTLQVNAFRTEVLEVDPTELGGQLEDIRTYGEVAGREIVRVGGPMASYLQLSFVLLIALAVLLERIVQGSRAPMATVGTVLVGSALLFTQTRSAIVGGCILVIATLRPAPGRATASRVQFTILMGLAAAIVVPLIFTAGLADRFTSGDVESDDVHEVRFDAAVDSIQDHPLGTGLGTGATGSQGVEGAIVPENQLLDVGVQLGVLGMVLAVGVVVQLIRQLWRAAALRPGASLEVLSARSALIGLLMPCWYLQPYSTPEVGWILFAIAGVALGSAEGAPTDASETPVRRAVPR